MSQKSGLKSKTVGVNVFGLLALIYEPSTKWIMDHPRATVGAVLLANIILRRVSKGKIVFTKPGFFKDRFGLFASMFAVMILTIGASNCAHIPFDRALSADKGNDYSMILSGYGTKSSKGYLFLPAAEGALTNQFLTLTFPVTACDRESCVRYQFFRKDASPGFAGAVKKGVSQGFVTLSQIIGHDGPLVAGDEGEYSIVSQVYFTGPDGKEYSMFGQGFVRLNVISKAFAPIACGDPNVAWRSAIDKDCIANFSTAYRSILCGSGCQ